MEVRKRRSSASITGRTTSPRALSLLRKDRHTGDAGLLHLQRGTSGQAPGRGYRLRRHRAVGLHGRIMIKSDIIQPLDMSKIPNFKNVGENFKGLPTTPTTNTAFPTSGGPRASSQQERDRGSKQKAGIPCGTRSSKARSGCSTMSGRLWARPSTASATVVRHHQLRPAGRG